MQTDTGGCATATEVNPDDEGGDVGGSGRLARTDYATIAAGRVAALPQSVTNSDRWTDPAVP